MRPIKPVTSSASRERRAAPRVPLRVGVSLAAGTLKVHGWVRDLSLGGCFLETRTPLPANARIDLEGLVRDGGRLIRLAAGGWVVRVTPTGMAIQFDCMDVATRTHLDRMVAEAPTAPA